MACAEPLVVLLCLTALYVVLIGWTGHAGAEPDRGDAAAPASLGPNATLKEIEACATRNLPEVAGVIQFSVDAIDRTGVVTASRAEIRWRKDDAELARILLRVSEPAKTAGTALLIIDREADEPEFFVRLPELPKVKRVRSRRLRGPVLGTDFSYEDLDRLRSPIARTDLELIGVADVEGYPAWLLETVPDEDDGSEYSRVLTYVDQNNCLPVQIDLYEGEDRLRKRLHAPRDAIRTVGNTNPPAATWLPHTFVMEDLRRETRTVVRIDRFEAAPDLPADLFTRTALQGTAPPASTR